MSLYPDNVNRAARVRQLFNDISWLQTTLKDGVDNARASDGAAFVELNTLAHDAGYKTLDEYVDAAAAQLTAKDRAGLESIGEGISGGQARADLREATVGLSARRFIVKELHLQSSAILNFKSDANSTVHMKSLFDDLIKDGKISRENATEKMKGTIDEIKADIKTGIDKVTPESIWDILAKQDGETSAWRDEDPSFDSILKWIKDHEN